MATLNQLGAPKVTSTRETVEGKWIEFPLGIFLLSTPTRTLENGNIVRSVEAYDGTLILQENQIDDRIALEAGGAYYDFIINGLKENGITKYNIERSEKTASVAVEWEPGTSWLRIINDCLSSLNYTPIFVDENGYFTSQLYRSPQERPADIEYITDEYSITYDGMEEELDIMAVPNKFTVVVNDPERTTEGEEAAEGEAMTLRSTYKNTNPNSPTSYQSRGGRWISDFRTVDDIADQEALDAYTERIAFEASQIYGHVSFETALNPIHGYADVLSLDEEGLGISGNYSETKWEMPLQVGGVMKHEARKVVDISGGDETE